MSARNLEAFFAPRHVAVLGVPSSPGQRQILDNLWGTVPAAQRVLVGARAEGWNTVRSVRQLVDSDLAVVFDGRMLRVAPIRYLADCGCRALVATTDVPIDRRALPRAADITRPTAGFHASAYGRRVAAGQLALIAQSRTIAAAALDWVEGRGLGLSLLATTGSEVGVDVADLLEYAALDPKTRSIVVQLGRIRSGRRFMSAAHAAARSKPVAILQTRAYGGTIIPALGADPVRSAAFGRAGLIECESLGELFDALAALDRSPADAEGPVAVIGNGAGVCALGVDALLREGIAPVILSEAVQREFRSRWPLVRFGGGALDVGSMEARLLSAHRRTDGGRRRCPQRGIAAQCGTGSGARTGGARAG